MISPQFLHAATKSPCRPPHYKNSAESSSFETWWYAVLHNTKPKCCAGDVIFYGLTKTSRDIKNGADKRKAIRMQHWGAEIMDYSTTLSQAQITVVIGLLSVPVLEKSLSKTTWVENPVNLVSLLSIKLLWVALSSDFMNQGQKIQLLVSFEVAKFTNAFWRHECCKILFRFYSLCQPASIDKAFKNGALPVGNNFFHYNI